MPTAIYSYSLCASITLMLFFGGYFLLGKLPDRETFTDFKRSRSLMGLALLTLATNYLVHLFVQPRLMNATFAISLNLSTYYLEAWLFSSALTTLLNPHYLTKRRFAMHIIGWMIYSSVCTLIAHVLPMGAERYGALILMGVWFGVYAFGLARRLYLTYKQAVNTFNDYSSEHIEFYIRSLSKFTYWAIVFGVGVGALTFLPDKYIPLWILSAIPFYIYLFCCYANYQIDCEHVSAFSMRR